MKRLITHIILTLSVWPMLFAQIDNVQDSTMFELPSLTDVITGALQHSPLLKVKSLEIKENHHELSKSKKNWMDYVYVEGAGNYGLFDQVVLSGISSDGETNTGLLTKNKQIRYYGGVSIKLPLSSVSKRKDEIQITRLRLESAEQEYIQLQKDIKQVIIDEYYQLKYMEESMKTFHSIYKTLEISYLKAEREVKNGRMGINEFALLASTVGKAKDDYYKAKNNFQAQYHRLQNLSGIIFEIN